MWVIKANNNKFYIGYYKPAGSFVNVMWTEGNANDDFIVACEMVNYLNGGASTFPVSAKEKILKRRT